MSMRRLITVEAVEGGFVWETQGTHGVKRAFSTTIAEAIQKSDRLLGGIEPATPPVILESPTLHLFRMGNGFAILKQDFDSLDMEIVGVLPMSVNIDQIGMAMDNVMAECRLELEHTKLHQKKDAEAKEAAEKGENVVHFPTALADGPIVPKKDPEAN